MGDGGGRREVGGFTMKLPMRVLPREGKGHELDAQTRDVSYRGLYFLTDANFEIGNEIEFVITLPQQVTQSGVLNIRCLAKVVRIEPTENGRVVTFAEAVPYYSHRVAPSDGEGCAVPPYPTVLREPRL